MLPAAFWQGVKEFNDQQFYACHDTLESLWLESCEPHKGFYQGILQIAVGCYHLERVNWKGAVTLLGQGTRRLKDYQPSYEQIAVCEIFTASYQLLKIVQSIRPEELTEQRETLKSLLPRIVKIETELSTA
jgi:uncharacterized protein